MAKQLNPFTGQWEEVAQPIGAIPTPTPNPNLESIQAGVSNVAAQIPNITELVQGMTTLPNLGTLPPADTKGVDTALINAKSTSELLAQQQAQQQKDKEAAGKALETAGATGETLWEKMLSLAGQKPKVETQEELEEQQTKYGVPGLLDGIGLSGPFRATTDWPLLMSAHWVEKDGSFGT